MRAIIGLFTLCCLALSDSNILVYSNDGFSVLNSNGTTTTNFAAANFFASQFSSDFLVVNDNLVLVYGSFQIHNMAPQNGLLQFNVQDQSWTNLGRRSVPPFSASNIDGIKTISQNEIIVVGSISHLVENPQHPLNNITYCNINTGQCFIMTPGLANYTSLGDIAVGQGIVYIAYQSKSSAKIVRWSRYGFGTWTEIFSVANTEVRSLAYANGVLYGIFFSYTPSKLNVLRSWNGTSWADLANLQGYCILTVSDTDALYVMCPHTIYVYQNNTLIPVVEQSNQILPPFAVSNDRIYYEVTESIGYWSIIEYYNNKTTEIMTTTLKPLLITNDNYLWVQIQNVSTISIAKYNSSVMLSSSQTDVYTTDYKISMICTFGSKIFAHGTFTMAENQKCPQNMAIWDTEKWIPVSLANYSEAIAARNLGCGNISSSLILATVTADYYPHIELVYENLTSEYFNSPFQLYLGQLWMWTVGSSVIISDLSNILTCFNVDTRNWTTIQIPFPIGSQIMDITGADDILYIGGSFNFVANGHTFQNVAKYNLTSQQWMPIDPVPVSNTIYDLSVGNVGNNATLYAGGKIQFGEFNGIAGCNEEGEWVDAVEGGFVGETIVSILYNYPDFYTLGSGGDLSKYDGQTLVPLQTGIQSIHLIQAPYSPFPALPSTPNKSRLYIWIGAAIGAILIVAMVAITIITYIRKRRSYGYELIPFIETGSEKRYSVRSISNIKLLENIGRGQFGDVYKATMEKTTVVAVKILKSSQKNELEKEVSILCALNHPHIVHLYGIHDTPTGSMMVFEYMSHGSLLSLIQEKREHMKNDIFTMAQHIVRGMCYLEEESIVHRDLALRNVLVTKDSEGRYVAKISDFGLSRITDKNYYQTADRNMPFKWTAIEAIEYGTYTSQSDVWSFGVCLWELMTYGKVPYAGMKNADAITRVRRGYRLERPEGCSDEVYEVMLDCWNQNPNLRPKFVELAQKIDAWVDVDKNIVVQNIRNVSSPQEDCVYN